MTAKTGIIYMAISPSGKIYIGQTRKSLRKRILEHRTDAFRKRNGKTNNSAIAKAIRKYGINNFSWEIIHSLVPLEKLNSLEIKTISYFESNTSSIGYNSTAGGEGLKGYSPTKTHRENLSKALKGRKVSLKSRKRLSELAKKRMKAEGNPMFGKSHSKETRNKISKTRIAKNLNKIGEEHHSAKLTEKDIIKIRELKKEGNSAKEIAKIFNISKGHVYDIISRRKWNHV